MEKIRFDYFDNGKAILIIMMVYAHIFQSGHIHDFIYLFHMGAFFMISGMQTVYSSSIDNKYSKFAISRLYSMGVPFVFFEVYGCIMYLIRYGFHQNIKGFIYNTVTLRFNNGVDWFLFTLLCVQLLFALIYKALRYCNFNIKNGTLIISILLIIIGGFILNNIDYRVIKILARTIYCLGLFAYGYWFTMKYGDVKQINICFIVGSFLCLTVISRIMMPVGGIANMDYGNSILAVISIMVGTYFVINIGHISLPKWFTWLGRNTLVIYGTHNSIYVCFGHLLGISDFSQTPFIKGMLLFSIVFILEMFIIYIVNTFFPFLIGKKLKRRI